jgi:capsular polysaccharide transport system permease protein
LIELRVLAFSPEDAHRIAKAILEECQTRLNELNEAARNDLMRYAEDDLADAVERLKLAREALTRFRIRTRIVDPNADLQGQMGVVNNLQQQLAEALVEFDLLLGTTQSNDPRIIQAQRRIDVIRERITLEREAFARDEVAGIGADYPTLMAEYESLMVDSQFAEETYRAALAAYDIARDKASRQSRYLAAYVRPSMAESSEFPRRFILTGLAALFLLMAWAIMALIYYSLRDPR